MRGDQIADKLRNEIQPTFLCRRCLTLAPGSQTIRGITYPLLGRLFSREPRVTLRCPKCGHKLKRLEHVFVENVGGVWQISLSPHERWKMKGRLACRALEEARKT